MPALVEELLVVAGEASGDRAAASVVARLPPGVQAVGMGGAALAAAGVRLVSDLRTTTALGVSEIVSRAWSIGRAFHRVLDASRHGVRVALLVNYTEFNARLAPLLHSRGIRVLWYGAPQIWAWRNQRAHSVRRSVDRMAVMLPFEESLWRAEGVDAHYVGHPAREGVKRDRASARSVLGLTPLAAAVAILPGSRPHEVRSLLDDMLQGFERVRNDRASVDARVLLAASLDEGTRRFAMARAKEAHVGVYEVDARTGAGIVLGAFDAALCASGTAALEAALGRAVPVVTYRVGLLTEIAARGLLRTKDIALPNILLGRHAFAELLQRQVQPKRIATELGHVLDSLEEMKRVCAEVEHALGSEACPSRRVAEMLIPWLETPSSASSPEAGG